MFEIVRNEQLGPTVRRVDIFMRQINPAYPSDKIGAFLILNGQRANLIDWIRIFPLDMATLCTTGWSKRFSEINEKQICHSFCSKPCFIRNSQKFAKCGFKRVFGSARKLLGNLLDFSAFLSRSKFVGEVVAHF